LKGFRLGLVAVVLAITTTACDQAAMSRSDARTFARRALASAGFTGVVVDRAVTLASYRSPDPKFKGDKPVRVWQTHSRVPEGTIDLYVPRTGNSAVFVRDEAIAGGPLLTDRQFRILRDFRLNPAADRRRNHLRGPTIAAVVLAVLVACALFVVVFLGRAGRRGRPAPGDESESPEPEREPAGVL
jgi:hypothetical protein